MDDTKKKNVLGGRYKLLDLLGKGGMATVYIALDEKLGRKVAVKVLHEHMEMNEEIRQRFYQEARAVSVLDHPNILKIYDFSGTRSKRLWIVMEIIKGYSLSDYVRKYSRSKLNSIVAASIVREICKALSIAHGHGIVHRDIKPENVMITDRGRVKLMDFGIAKDLQNHSMTQTGTFMGSPSYMSPEQVKGQSVTHLTDIYSLGVLFYEIVTGRLPFIGKTTHELTMKIVEGKFVAPRYIVPDLHEEIDELICKCMSKNQRSRLESANILGSQIDLHLASQGFVESHVELERYFKDRAAYQARLDQLSRIKNRRITKVDTTAFDHTEDDTPRVQQQDTKPQTADTTLPETQQAPVAPNINIAEINREKTNLIKAKARYLVPQPVVQQKPAVTTRDRRSSVARQPNRITYDKQRQRKYFRRQSNPSQSIVGILAFAVVVATMIWGFVEVIGRLEKAPQTDNPTPRVEVRPTRAPRPTPVDSPSSAPANRPSITANSSTETVSAPTVRETPKQTPVIRASGAPTAKTPERVVRRPETRTQPVRPEKRPVTRATQQAEMPRGIRTVRPTRTPSIPRSEAVPAPAPVADNIVDQVVIEPEPIDTVEDPKPTREPPVTAIPTPVVKPVGEQYAYVKIKSNPAAEIYLGNKLFGTTVENVSDSGWLKVKAGRTSLKLKRNGYEAYTQTLDLKPNERSKLPTITLAKGSSTSSYQVMVHTSHTPVTISVRNSATRTEELMSSTQPNYLLTLPAGDYSITLTYGNQKRKRKIVLPGPSKSSRLTFDAIFTDGSK